MREITIITGDIRAAAKLEDNATADTVWEALPLEARANTWGDEIYFGIPVSAGEAEDANELVDRGDIAYWPPGKAFCIFFGTTPASRGDEIRAASAVNKIGRLDGDPAVFKGVPDGAVIRVEKA